MTAKRQRPGGCAGPGSRLAKLTAYWMLACVAAAAGLAGCGDLVGKVNGTGKMATGPLDREPPEITALNVTPTTAGLAGAPLMIEAEVTDPNGVRSVWAAIGPVGAPEPEVGLVKASGQTYRGVWHVPANAARGVATKTYTVAITAWDSQDNATTADPVTVTCTLPPLPPAPPVAGR